MKPSEYTGDLEDRRASSLNENNSDFSIEQPIKLHDSGEYKSVFFFLQFSVHWNIGRYLRFFVF